MSSPEQPYYAVVFSSQRSDVDGDAYAAMAERMLSLAAEQPGFLGVESARGGDGFGITVSYWESREAIAAWKANADHLLAQQLGRTRWYTSYRLRICKVEREKS